MRSRFESRSALGVFQARICLSRKVLGCCLVGCLGGFWNPNTAVPPTFSFSPNLWQDYSSMHLHVYPSNESSELILSSSHLSCLPAVGFLCWFVNLFFKYFFNLLWALYPTTSVCTGWHSPWLAESSPSQFVHVAPATKWILFWHVTCQFL